MEKKKVMIVSLLVVAIILSGTSILMNVSVMQDVKFSEAPVVPMTPQVSVEVLPPETTMGGVSG